MPRGAPDFGIYAVKEAPIVGLADVGEAVARLGAINVWDRKGWTVLFDDFEAPTLNWIPQTEGSGETPVLSSTQAFMGSQSCYLSAPAAASSVSKIWRRFPLLSVGKLGVELWIQAKAYSPGYFQFYFYVYDGAIPTLAEVLYDTVAREITLGTAAGNIVVASDVFMYTVANYFLPIKVVIDIENDKYVRLMVGPQEIDISAHDLITFAPSTDRYISLTIACLGCEATDMWAYVDNFILTQNEP